MEQQIQQAMEELGDLLAKHPLIVEYHELKVQVEQCEILHKYEEKIKEAQKEMVQTDYYRKPKAHKYWEKEADKYQKLIDEHPLVMTYRENLSEVNDLLQLITTTITEQINQEGEKDATKNEENPNDATISRN